METFFFWVSKLAWIIVKPDNLLLISIIIVLVLLWTKSYLVATRLLTFIVFCMLIIAFMPLGNLLLYPLETRFETNPVIPKHIDGIIVLGGAAEPKKSRVWNQIQLNEAAERYSMFQYLAKQYPEAKLIFTGGTGYLLNQADKEAEVAKSYFHKLGMDTSRIVFERESRNTYENGVYSKKIVQPKSTENWILITTAWHMPRSVGIFCNLGWAVIPYPVDHSTYYEENLLIDFDLNKNLKGLSIAIKEWIGLTVYYLTGKTTNLLPNKCN